MLLWWVSLTPSDGLISWFDGLASLLGFSNVAFGEFEYPLWWINILDLTDWPLFFGFSNVSLMGYFDPL